MSSPAKRRSRDPGVLSAMLGLRLPIVQAPMAGVSNANLVSAVAQAGALGSFGHAYTEPEAMRADVAAVRAHGTRLPIHINLFVDAPAPAQTPEAVAAALGSIKTWYQGLGLELPVRCDPPYAPSLDAQIEAALALRPTVLSCHLNPFSREIVREAQAQGIVVAGTATNVAEALVLQDLGMDVVIAQSGEAGGHRGTFIGDPADSMTGTLSLVRLMHRRCELPIIAAGGVMDGAAIAACLMLGASAVQMGTAFLNTEEASTSAAHRQALTADSHGDAQVSVTTAFSGRPAQGIRNGFMQSAAQAQARADWHGLPFPAQNKLTAPLRAAAAKAGVADVLSMWAGHAHALARRLSAAQLLAQLELELAQARQQAF